MIKGVNKQVLEVAQTENSYFEKAIFFVKPEYSGLSEGRLQKRAKKELDSAGLPPIVRRYGGKERLRKGLIFMSLFTAGVISGILFTQLL